jgi:hypothetical protein
MLRLRHRGLDKPSVLRIDASAASQLSPGFGFTSWRGADHLLTPMGRGAIGGPKELERELERECQRRQRHDLSHNGDSDQSSDHSTHSHDDDAVADGDRVAGPASTALLCCVLREVSSEHLLLSGVLPSLSSAARKEIEALPVGIAPMHGGDSRHAPTPWANSKGPPPQRCLCCATHLRKLKGDSGAVCAHGSGHIMRDARTWFKEEVTRWRPAAQEVAKEAAGAQDDDEANNLPVASFHAQAAGNAGSETESHEDEDAGEEDEAEIVGAAEGASAVASGDHAEAYDAMLATALVCPHGHVVLIYDLEPAEEEEEEEGDEDEGEDEDEDEDEDEEWEDEWDEDEEEDEWDGEEEEGSWDEDEDEDEDEEDDGGEWLEEECRKLQTVCSRPPDAVEAAFSY